MVARSIRVQFDSVLDGDVRSWVHRPVQVIGDARLRGGEERGGTGEKGEVSEVEELRTGGRDQQGLRDAERTPNTKIAKSANTSDKDSNGATT